MPGGRARPAKRQLLFFANYRQRCIASSWLLAAGSRIKNASSCPQGYAVQYAQFSIFLFRAQLRMGQAALAEKILPPSERHPSQSVISDKP